MASYRKHSTAYGARQQLSRDAAADKQQIPPKKGKPERNTGAGTPMANVGATLSPLSKPAQASMLSPSVVRNSLYRLQRSHGNRYVRRMLQRSGDDGGEVTPDVERAIERSRGGGQPLDSGIQSRMGQALDADFSLVRVHTGAEADSLNRSLSARAFTSGRDIYFRDGEYNPATSGGRELLAHELTHVVQQGTKSISRKLTLGRPDDVYEQEADNIARAIVTNEHRAGVSQIKRQIDSEEDKQDLIQAAPYSKHIQRENGDEEPVETEEAGETITESTPDEIADDFETAAYSYFDRNMSMELRNAAAIEGAAIGRRASTHMANMVRETCEPYERDQELDTNIMNTVFVVSGGAANVTRNVAGGRSATGRGGINLASRIVNIGLNLLQTWMPTLAGYKTVGELKDATTRVMAEQAAQSGETTSSTYGDYENDVMDQLDEDFEQEVTASSSHIRSAVDSQEAQNISIFGQSLFGMWRATFLNKVRREYGSRSIHERSMISRVEGKLRWRLARLRRHLEDAKTSRERWQAAGAIGGGIAGGAALGAGIGALFGGVGAAPGAVIGGAVGGIVGTIGAISILWD